MRLGRRGFILIAIICFAPLAYWAYNPVEREKKCFCGGEWGELSEWVPDDHNRDVWHQECRTPNKGVCPWGKAYGGSPTFLPLPSANFMEMRLPDEQVCWRISNIFTPEELETGYGPFIDDAREAFIDRDCHKYLPAYLRPN